MSSLDRIFKAYIITKGKLPTRAYKDPANQYSLEEVQGMPSYAGLLSEEAILVDLDNSEEGELLLSIIQAEGVKCRVHRTDHGLHVYFIGHHLPTTKTKYASVIGLNTDYKLGSRNGISILKLNGTEREVVYDTDEIGELPAWLYPISKEVPEFLKMGNGDGRNDALYRYILTLQSAGLTKDECRQAIHIINKHILKDPLPEKEIDTILRDDAFPSESFYDAKGKLQVRKFEEHFCREVHAIKLDRHLHIYRDGVYVCGDEMIRGKMLDFLPDLTFAQRNEVLNRSKDRIQVFAKRAPAYLISFRNGTFNMTTKQMEPHDPKNIITNIIDWNYNPDAYSEVADRTLDKLACNDPTIRALLEEIIGYCFYRRNELGKAFIFLGDNSNGKSTYMDILRYILGDENTAALSLQELDHRFKTSGLLNKLADIGDDIPKTWVPDASLFKKIVTGDRINVEFKGRDAFEFDPYTKIILSANEMPRIDDETGAVKRRLTPVPFKAKFSPTDPDFDPFIKDKLKSEVSIEYFIRIGLEGLERVLKKRRFSTNEAIEKELKDIDTLNNPILQFIDDVDSSGIINHSTAEVYDTYKSYCIECGLQPVARNSFVRQINTRLGTVAVRKMVKGENLKIFQLKD